MLIFYPRLPSLKRLREVIRKPIVGEYFFPIIQVAKQSSSFENIVFLTNVSDSTVMDK